MTIDQTTEQDQTDYRGSVPIWRVIPFDTRRKVHHYILNIITAIGLFVIIFPIYWTFVSSLSPTLFDRELQLFPSNLTFDHYIWLLTESQFWTWFKNSLILSFGVVAITTPAATFGGYGLTRIDIPHKEKFARSILFSYMFPAILLAIPMFIFFRQFGMVNTYPGMILGEVASALPISLWLMWQFFQSVPFSIEESAQVAGASRFRAFYEIALPVAKPGVFAVVVFSFASGWGSYTIPKILMTDFAGWPLTIGIETLHQGDLIRWGPLLALAFLMMIPPFILVYIMQDYLLRGFNVS